MQSTESLSLSALIMWTNQCLLSWLSLARPQRRLNDEGTHLLSVTGPPTCPEWTCLRKLQPGNFKLCVKGTTKSIHVYIQFTHIKLSQSSKLKDENFAGHLQRHSKQIYNRIVQAFPQQCSVWSKIFLPRSPYLQLAKIEKICDKKRKSFVQ